MASPAANEDDISAPEQQPGSRLTDHGRPRSVVGLVAVWSFVTVPVIAILVVPALWGWGFSPLNLALALVMYAISGFGISVGFHRYLTHGAFKTNTFMRVLISVAGSMAMAGAPTQWVATHRHHHANADREGDPHSPWRYGVSFWAVGRGLCYAHIGWMFEKKLSNIERFAPDLRADPALRGVDRMFVVISVVSMLGPAVIGGLVTQSWIGAWSALLWAGILRVAILHHVIWSVNSLCHVVGARPFKTRDHATNFWPLAVVSFGESWHNSHHADPTLARHGVLPGQWDPAARVIWLMERFRLVHDVRWPTPERIATKLRVHSSA